MSSASYMSLHSGYFNETLRTWQSRTSKVDANCLIYPIFISSNDEAMEEIPTLPEQYRIGVNKIREYLSPAVTSGLKTVLLFGIPPDDAKDKSGTKIINEVANPVFRAIREIRASFPDLTIACDVCLCSYTSHGHCGVIDVDGNIINDESVYIIASAACAYAEAGAHIVAPSDMMDGRISSIDDLLKKSGIRRKTCIMSYSAKFASCFYGPFRDACSSAPGSGDRKSYQLPPGSSALAKRAVRRDAQEGADMVMVKPGTPYLDIVRQTKDLCPDLPVAVYQVSGEYAMLWHAAANGVFTLRSAVFESVEGMHRAGADVVITYYAPRILQWLKEDS